MQSEPLSGHKSFQFIDVMVFRLDGSPATPRRRWSDPSILTGRSGDLATTSAGASRPDAPAPRPEVLITAVPQVCAACAPSHREGERERGREGERERGREGERREDAF